MGGGTRSEPTIYTRRK